ncbi:YbaN family protein [Massilia sp. IC2-476]|uniref:YbaN family protein n=1 Tax=Massilia sp. IC2-476 TaxID=2887199 RepID=UPI001D0F53B9|nr:YbaN family protein [Massilia sp. IC2-476]MCC2971162.1 YbaN family protein [Massilia sp. IC2-476]
MKPFYNAAGVLALLLGILGIFLPLLPTTPFLLLASWCFARGSERLHGWLLSHRVFGEYLRNFEAGRGIPLKAKIVATAMLWTSLLLAIGRLLESDRPLLVGVLLLTGAGVSIYLWRYLPTLRLERPGRG